MKADSNTIHDISEREKAAEASYDEAISSGRLNRGMNRVGYICGYVDGFAAHANTSARDRGGEMSDMSNCKNCGHPEVAHSKGELKCWIGHHCSCAGFEVGYADTKQAPLTTETPSPTTLEAEFDKFLLSQNGCFPNEPRVCRDCAIKFTDEKVQAEREKWQRELIESLDSFIEELRGKK